MSALARILVMVGFFGCYWSSPKPAAAQPRKPPQTPQTTPAKAASDNPSAIPPGAPKSLAAVRPHLVQKCLVAFADADTDAECNAAVGLPAVSKDGTRVIIPDFGPDTGRDEVVLTVRTVVVDTGKLAKATVILSYDDYLNGGANFITGTLSDGLRNELARRIEEFDKLVQDGGYRPLTGLGTVYEGSGGNTVNGLRASFDNDYLTIRDVQVAQALWTRYIGPSEAREPVADDELRCGGSSRVAEIRVWVSRKPKLAVAHVTYVSDDLCDAEYTYLVWP